MSTPSNRQEQALQFLFPEGVERVLHDVRASEALPGVLDRYAFRRVAIVCSRTLRNRTGVIHDLEVAIGDRLVAVIDEIGEHAHVGNILKAIEQLRALRADVMVSVGGGSVLDFAKFVQLGLSEGVHTREELLRFTWRLIPGHEEVTSVSAAAPAIRQIAIPTTLATAEWTPGGTPLDETTHQKVRLMARQGAPLAILYDPEILRHTPFPLLAATGVRGLDHAINTALAVKSHPLASMLAEQAIVRYMHSLPRLKRDPGDLAALASCQIATWFTGMGQTSMGTYHGFSHWMVHILAPLAGIGHSDAACVLMLAQARWFEPEVPGPYLRLREQLGSPGGSFADFLENMLKDLGLPTTLEQLGVDSVMVEDMIPLALEHPLLTRWNLRPVRTGDDLRRVLHLGRPG